MFEKRLMELSKQIPSEGRRKYFILTHTKHLREIYVEIGNRKALKFVNPKFNSTKKRFIYALAKIGFLQIFLKKIILPKEFGNIILIGGQIKGFDLENEEVISFPKEPLGNKEFMNSKKFQKKISKAGFAPRILELNEKVPYSKEKLLRRYPGGKNIEIFKKLNKFYNFQPKKEIPLREYVLSLKKELKNKGIEDGFLVKEIDKISEGNFKVKICLLHGDFSEEQVLMKGKEFLFVDWHPYEGIITNDLVNFSVRAPRILRENFLKRIIKFYPKSVGKNIKAYLVLSKISLLKDKKIKKYQLVRGKRTFSNIR